MIDFCWGCLGKMAQSGVAVSDELLGLVCRAHFGRTVRNSVGTLLGGGPWAHHPSVDLVGQFTLE